MTLRHSGHILGAATVDLEWKGKRIVFSGDLGRFDDEVMLDPETVAAADYLVVESTYGDRRHDSGNPEDALAEVINSTTARGGTVVIPAFAVGRVQALLYHLERAIAAGKLRPVPVFLDSPMAINASELLCAHLDDHRLPRDACVRACYIAQYVRDVEESKALTHNPVPKVIISASGMATGGRVLHHLKRYAPERRNAILFAGFQAAGTRGAAMVAGADSIRIHGEDVPVRAEVHNLSMLSAHADADEIIKWLGGFAAPPRETFICHGEPSQGADHDHARRQEMYRYHLLPTHCRISSANCSRTPVVLAGSGSGNRCSGYASVPPRWTGWTQGISCCSKNLIMLSAHRRTLGSSAGSVAPLTMTAPSFP